MTDHLNNDFPDEEWSPEERVILGLEEAPEEETDEAGAEAGSEEEGQQAAAETDDEDGSEEGEEGPKKGGSETVPHGRFHQERQRRIEAEERAKKAEEAYILGDERLAKLLERISPKAEGEDKPADAPAPPSWDEDFITAGKQTSEQVNQIVRQQQLRDEQQRFDAVLGTAASQYVEKVPDLGARDAFVVGKLAEGYAIRGATPQQAHQQAVNDVKNHLYNLSKRGQDVQTALDWVAQTAEQYGYKPAEPAKAEEVEDKNEAETFRKRAEAAERSTTLSGTGGGAAPSDISMASLSKMSQKEFDALYAKDPDAIVRAMGG